MKNTKKKKPISAEAIARMADLGKDISGFFTNKGIMVYPVQRVTLDFTTEMLEELDHEAARLNITRQAVIKTLVREGLDRRLLLRTRRASRAHRSRAQRW